MKSFDPFWDPKEQDRLRREQHEAAVGQLEAQIGLARRSLALTGSPGYEEFAKAVDRMLESATSQMVSSTATDSYLRILQGRVQALRDVSGILRRTEHTVKVLEQQLQELRSET